jgi:hypothetical protein
LLKPKRGIMKVGFEILTAAGMNMAVFWIVAACSPVEFYLHFRGTCCLHNQSPYDRGIKYLRNVGKFLLDFTALKHTKKPQKQLL